MSEAAQAWSRPVGGSGETRVHNVVSLPDRRGCDGPELDRRARELATTRCALFDGVPQALRMEMVADGVAQQMFRGEELYTEGTASAWGYVVARGTTALGRTTLGRKRQFMTLFLPGDVFGMVNIFDGSPYTARAVAMSDGMLLKLPAETILAWPSLDPRVARAMVTYLAHQVLRANGSVAGLLCPDVGSKLATFLLDLASRAGTPSGDGIIVRLALTQEQLAQHVGASRESVNRALREMVRRRIIEMEYGELRVLDEAWLRRKSQRA